MVVLVCRSAKVAPTPIVREHLYRAAHTPSPPPNHCCPSFLDQLVPTSTLFLPGAQTPLLQMDTSWTWGCSVLSICGVSRLLPLSAVFSILLNCQPQLNIQHECDSTLGFVQLLSGGGFCEFCSRILALSSHSVVRPSVDKRDMSIYAYIYIYIF